MTTLYKDDDTKSEVESGEILDEPDDVTQIQEDVDKVDDKAPTIADDQIYESYPFAKPMKSDPDQRTQQNLLTKRIFNINKPTMKIIQPKFPKNHML
jgi:hypothetical protein